MKKKSMIIVSMFFIILLSTNLAFGEMREIKLNQVEWKKMNTFFSNFSEVFLKPFKKGQITNKELIRFGIFHNIFNNYFNHIRIYI